MKKIKPPKLTLSPTTIRVLKDAQLAAVAGGASIACYGLGSQACCPTTITH